MKSVGTVVLSERRWAIQCAPHVMIRLKRVFERIDKGSHGYVTLSDTPENGRELEWFLQRFPMEMDAAATAHLAGRAEEHRRHLATLEEVLADDYEPRAFDLAVTPRQYQAVAADLLLRSHALLLADEVGLGKTASAIAALTDPRTRPALVVTLAHLPPQWVREIEKFAPGMRAHILRSSRPYDLTKGRRGAKEPLPDVIVSSYAKLSGWADTLAPIIRTVIFDECQELRRGYGKGPRPVRKYTAAQHLSTNATFRAGLSATPIYNYGGELWNVLNVLSPDALGTREEFGREWCGAWSDKARVSEPRAFGRYLREQGLMLRRTRRDVARELPGLTRIPYAIDCDLGVLDKVHTTATELARIILDQGKQVRGAKLRASEELNYLLRQATGIAKAPYVAAFVRMLIESGERVVLYGWHHAVYDIWRESLKDFQPLFYTGQESVKQKEEARRLFVEGRRHALLIVSLRAGAGMDGLQHVCRTAVHGELDWSPAAHEQCDGRLFRDGQLDPVMSYFPICDAGTDPIVADVLSLKRQQVEGVRDPDAELIEKLEVDPGHIRRLAEQYLARHGAAR